MSHLTFVSFAFAVTALASGCVSSDGDGGDDEGPGPGPGPGPGSVIPRTGAWVYSEVTPVSSTCPAGIEGQADDFAIDRADASSFHVIPNDGTEAFTCTINGATYACPDRAFGTEDFRPQLDAIASYRATATGTFNSATSAAGTQRVDVTCTGSGCPATTCTFTVNFVARAI